MIVPKYWAEARARSRTRGRQITVRRFGWSDVSEAEARSHAEERARLALEHATAGHRVPRSEPRVPYNGAEGVPIREEIISTHGTTILTRNAYGALCLNTENVLFADLDFGSESGCAVMLALLLILEAAALALSWRVDSLPFAVVSVLLCALLAAVLGHILHRFWIRLRGGEERIARRRIDRFLANHPDWHVRLYRTPAGFRLLAMQATFDPRSAEVSEFFNAVKADPLYVRMCQRQQCFRARVSPKPWRVGIDSHLKPRPGVWPIAPERLPERQQWVAVYDRAASGYSSCRYIESLGSGRTDPHALSVQKLHDELSRSTSDLPIA